ncbi:MAG: glutaredoxin 3 [Deltaproteobacteria bacterium]
MKTVRIYTTTYCGYCRSAKALLDRKGVAYEEIDVTEDDAAREALTKRSGQRTVPQIWVGETHVGGFSDLDALERQGKLDELLR